VLAAVCANADTERPELEKAKAFLTKGELIYRFAISGQSNPKA
jgi:hypothetical protein